MSAAMSAAFSPFRTNSPLTVVKLTDGGSDSPLEEKRLSLLLLETLRHD